jgi:hypothetical protein
MGRFRAEDLARLGESARRQIELAQFAYRERGKLHERAKANKFGAIPTTVDGQRFASKAEADRYGQLKVLQRVGRITELVCQPEFPIEINGIKIAVYIADFQYYDQDGELVIEDVKSPSTKKLPTYRLKRKLVEAIYGITIVEVM